MEWFFAYNQKAEGWFSEMIKVAVVSAKTNTSLIPHCIYDGQPTELTAWLEKSGVKIHIAEVPFKDKLFSAQVAAANQGTLFSPHQASGAFLRILASDYASGDIYLYTDCDVMFRRGTIVKEKTDTISAVKELNSHSSFNSGVMLCNTSYMQATKEKFIKYIEEKNFYDINTKSYDQTFLNQFHAGLWQPLREIYNWRPFQGFSDDAEIVHFHGPKPHRIKSILAGDVLKAEEALLSYISKSPEGYEKYLDEFYKFLAEGAINNYLPS